jgi:hypothetical protein
MTSGTKRARIALVGCIVAAAFAASASAQAPSQQRLPNGWTYEVDGRGNRVAKVNRVMQPDGSWREEIRQGNCMTVRERSATGEFKETQQCKSDKSR